MSEETPQKSAPETPSGNESDESRIAIVGSCYNAIFTDAMVNAASTKIGELLPRAKLEVHRVPGAFEIPVVVEALCRRQSNSPDVVIALGVIIRGSTAHADLIAESITRSLHDCSRENLVPVIHEVLLVGNIEQAEERALGERLNRGREAAEAAVAILDVMRAVEAG